MFESSSLRNYIFDYILNFAHLKDLTNLMKVSRKLHKIIISLDEIQEFKLLHYKLKLNMNTLQK
jgi:hypothetical protein